jgi:hypothetical protein
MKISSNGHFHCPCRCRTYGDDSVSTFQRLSSTTTPHRAMLSGETEGTTEEEGSRATYVKHSLHQLKGSFSNFLLEDLVLYLQEKNECSD